MEKGFIKLFRKMKDWKWYTHPTTMRVFIHLLFCANWEDKKVNGVELKRGQVLITWKQIANDLKILDKNNKPSRQPVRTALKNLKLTNDITIKKTNKGSIITINNYNNYQDLTTNPTNKDRKTNQQLNHEPNQHTKEEKNINNNIYIFIKPSRKEVADYFLELNSTLDSKEFYDYFEENGWTICNKIMKDWKAAVRSWINLNTSVKEQQDGI